MPKRILQGKVVSAKAAKTVVVEVERRVMHSVYKKPVKKKKKYHAHDEQSRCKEGQVIKIIESRPFSKTKSWEVVYEG